MSLLPFSCYAGSPVPAGFASMAKDTLEATPRDLGDGWSIYYTAQVESAAMGGTVTPSGDAAWVTPEATADGHRISSGWAELNIVGPANTAFDFEVYGRGPSGGRILDMRLNGGSVTSFDQSDNITDTQVFSGSTDASGKAVFEYSKGASSSGHAYLVAGRVIPSIAPPPPSVTIDTEMTPGGTSVLTYSDFDAAPTGTVTATPLDGSGDPIVGFTPLTYTGTVADTDTAGVHSGTVTVNWPALVDGETTLPFGTNNVRLSITS